MDDDEEDEVGYDDLTKEEKYQVLQQLYAQYQEDPDNFPEDQRELLERELQEFFGEEEEEEEEKDDDERMQIEGQINFPDQPLPQRHEEPEDQVDEEPDLPEEPQEDEIVDSDQRRQMQEEEEEEDLLQNQMQMDDQ